MYLIHVSLWMNASEYYVMAWLCMWEEETLNKTTMYILCNHVLTTGLKLVNTAFACLPASLVTLRSIGWDIVLGHGFLGFPSSGSIVIFLAMGFVRSAYSQPLQFAGPELSRLSENCRNHLFCSLISSSTAIEMDSGEFESSTLHGIIAGVAGEHMAYPLTYIHSSVESESLSDVVEKASAQICDQCSCDKRIDEIGARWFRCGRRCHLHVTSGHFRIAWSLFTTPMFELGKKVTEYGRGLIYVLVTLILAMQKIPFD